MTSAGMSKFSTSQSIPSSRFTRRSSGRTRVPRRTGAPDILPGTVSIRVHSVQSIPVMKARYHGRAGGSRFHSPVGRRMSDASHRDLAAVFPYAGPVLISPSLMPVWLGHGATVDLRSIHVKPNSRRDLFGQVGSG
jgi:hypothetical protein